MLFYNHKRALFVSRVRSFFSISTCSLISISILFFRILCLLFVVQANFSFPLLLLLNLFLLQQGGEGGKGGTKGPLLFHFKLVFLEKHY